MDDDSARRLAADWLVAWNTHDLDAVLAHFADDVVFTSPIAAQVLPETGGVVRGREQLRQYWAAALLQVADLHFEIEQIFAGVDTVVINHRNQRGTLVCEVLRLADGLVVRGDGTYLLDPT